MKLLQIIEKDSKGIVRLQIKDWWLSRPEWVFGFEEDRHYNLHCSNGRNDGLHFRSAADGQIHKWSWEINRLYCEWLKAQREKTEAVLALDKFLELDNIDHD